jgi:hypothetical protein
MFDNRADFVYNMSMAENTCIYFLDNRTGLIRVRCISAKITPSKN